MVSDDRFDRFFPLRQFFLQDIADDDWICGRAAGAVVDRVLQFRAAAGVVPDFGLRKLRDGFI